MAPLGDPRKQRLHKRADRPEDQRSAFQRDRDRILYSSAFRRLGGVTQVVSAAEGDIFHNRLTHSLKVGQIGRRLAEKLAKKQPDLARLIDVDPDVVEAAGLAHDLGHPPFGHIAEEELHACVGDLHGGFEGNAQTLRVVTRLAVRGRNYGGLDLTRATLNAILKYPWLRDLADKDKQRKWGAYPSDVADFTFARIGSVAGLKSPEAMLMDWADDITYAVHDVEDFYRAGMLPLERLAGNAERRGFLRDMFKRWTARGEKPRVSRAQATKIANELLGQAPFTGPFGATRLERARLRSWTAGLIGRCVDATTLTASPPFVRVDPQIRAQVEILKQLTWHYVILNPALATQQVGQRRIVRELFAEFHGAACSNVGDWRRKLIPAGFQEALVAIDRPGADQPTARRRLAADVVASLTEQQAVDTHRRLTGVESGSMMRPIM